MGRIQDFFGKLLNRGEEKPLQLTDGESEVSEILEEDKAKEFRTRFAEVRAPRKTEPNKREDDSIQYNPQNFKKHPSWRKWYTEQELRNNYYSANNKELSEGRLTYGGALLIMKEGTSVRIMCTCIDEDRQIQKIELCRTNGPIYKAAMYEIDSILSLQVSRTFKDSHLEEEILRHYDALKMKDLELSSLGKKILSYTQEGILELPNVPEEDLYKEKIDFMSLPTKQTVSQMQVTCVQADTESQSLEEISKKVESFYEYCKLAIDIGVFGKEDWKLIDDSYYWQQVIDRYSRRDNRTNITNNNSNTSYNRVAHSKRSSFEEIRGKYLTEDQLKELKAKMLTTSLEQRKQGYIGTTDVEEICIKEIVQETMEKLPLRLEEYILAYQFMHEKDKDTDGKLKLLNDMVTYSKQKFLEERGLYIGSSVKTAENGKEGHTEAEGEEK